MADDTKHPEDKHFRHREAEKRHRDKISKLTLELEHILSPEQSLKKSEMIAHAIATIRYLRNENTSLRLYAESLKGNRYITIHELLQQFPTTSSSSFVTPHIPSSTCTTTTSSIYPSKSTSKASPKSRRNSKTVHRSESLVQSKDTTEKEDNVNVTVTNPIISSIPTVNIISITSSSATSGNDSSNSNHPTEKNSPTVSHPSSTDDDEIGQDEDIDEDEDDEGELDALDDSVNDSSDSMRSENLNESEEKRSDGSSKGKLGGRKSRKNSKSSGASLNDSVTTSIASKGKKRSRSDEDTTNIGNSSIEGSSSSLAHLSKDLSETGNRRSTRARVAKDSNNKDFSSGNGATHDLDAESRSFIRQNLSSLVETLNIPLKRRQRYRGTDIPYALKVPMKPTTTGTKATKVSSTVPSSTTVPLSSSSSSSQANAVVSTVTSHTPPLSSNPDIPNGNAPYPPPNPLLMQYMINSMMFNPSAYDATRTSYPSFLPSVRNMNDIQRSMFNSNSMMYPSMFPTFSVPSSFFPHHPSSASVSNSSIPSIMNPSSTSSSSSSSNGVNELSEPFSSHGFASRFNLPMGSLPYPGPVHHTSPNRLPLDSLAPSMHSNPLFTTISANNNNNTNFIPSNDPSSLNNNYNNGYSNTLSMGSMFSNVFPSSNPPSSILDSSQHPTNTNNSTFSASLSSTPPMYNGSENIPSLTHTSTNGQLPSNTTNTSHFVPIHRPTGLRSSELLLVSPDTLITQTSKNALPNLSSDSPITTTLITGSTPPPTVINLPTNTNTNDNNNIANFCNDDGNKPHPLLSTTNEYVMNNVSTDSSSVETLTITV